MSKKPVKIAPSGLPLAIVKQMLSLATAGFGLVAALAWNEVIKEVIVVYIKPYVASESGVLSLLVYALIVTILAVFITLQLTRIQTVIEAKTGFKQ